MVTDDYPSERYVDHASNGGTIAGPHAETKILAVNGSELPPGSMHLGPDAQRIAILLPSLMGGGAERSMLTLADALIARGRDIDLVLCRVEGAYLDDVPAAARIVELKPTTRLRARLTALKANPRGLLALIRPVLLPSKGAPEIEHLVSLQRYLRDTRPDVILSALTYANLVALWARRLANVPTRVIVSERITLSRHCWSAANLHKWRWRFLPTLVQQTYPKADAIVAVSDYVADDLATCTTLPRHTIRTIYNPVVDTALQRQASQSLEHPWFSAGSSPVILGVGRLTAQKDFATLLRAFARLRSKREAHLMILGEGKQRQVLEDLVNELDLQAEVQLPGFVSNPFQYMARASVLALSSLYEGLPGVLIQALACGCPVVSTDCPGGSSEILEQGKFGPLVAVGDDTALSEAIGSLLDHPPDKQQLQSRAAMFSVNHAAEQFLGLIDELAENSARNHPLDSSRRP